MLAQLLLDVGKSDRDAALVSLERLWVDGVGELCGEELVTLSFESCPAPSELPDAEEPP